MNRPTDSRSDLYSYGVMLYRMVTGVLPFTAKDPMEWIHCHLAVQPMPPNECAKTVPAQLSAIIMKLLAKMPEERYQTAMGVEKDLKKCLETLESGGPIAPFPLGMHDVPHQLLISDKLYGRDSEIQTLISAFKRVASDGRAELLLVSGYSGIGKTAVVNQLPKHCVAFGGLFASGKFDQYKENIPYTTLRYEPGTIVAEKDFVIVHGRFSGFQPVNWIVADILRIEDGALAEHWDVIQDEATKVTSKSACLATSSLKGDNERKSC